MRKRLIGSLFEDGVDMEAGIWNHDTIVNNAKESADILMLCGKSQNPEFFPTILNGLQAGRYYSTMAYLFFTTECRHSPPPYCIVQYAVDDKLLEEFCVALRDELFYKAEAEGHLSWLDPTVRLLVGYYL